MWRLGAELTTYILEGSPLDSDEAPFDNFAGDPRPFPYPVPSMTLEEMAEVSLSDTKSPEFHAQFGCSFMTVNSENAFEEWDEVAFKEAMRKLGTSSFPLHAEVGHFLLEGPLPRWRWTLFPSPRTGLGIH